jgi:phage terminase small subunit
MALTEKQKNFCHEYLIDLNASLAYKRAGYAGNDVTAGKNGYKLLNITEIQLEIQRLQDLRAKRTDITADKVLTAVGAIAFTPITQVLKIEGQNIELFDSAKWSPAARLAVESVRKAKDGSITVKMHNKVDALGKLMQHLGMLSDLNIAIATLKTYGEVQTIEEGYRVILHAKNAATDQD